MCEGFTDIEYKYCLEATEKLIENPLSSSFLRPVDPEHDNLPKYFEIVKEPMDLGTIKHNLADRKYKSSSQWRDDVMKVWDNSLKYNTKGIYKSISEKMRNTSLKLLKVIPKTETDLWYIDLHEAAKELQSFLKLSPTSSGMSRSKSKKRID